ncbi:MAG: DUF4097 family beta strand repeat-containing protein [Candidatus Poribacteria bacterium]|nr:DUF4097 family beta strand repeat-containing protein [Candidatus Poribacteria bacterium]
MEQQRQQELKGLFHILEHTAKIAEDAALTGTFSGGEARCIIQFNNVLTRLNGLDAVPDGLFEELHEDASFSQIGIACHQLAAYLNEELDTTADFKGWLDSFFGKRFMENLTEELSDKPFGDLIRKAVPDFLTESTLEDIAETFPVVSGGKLTIDADCGGIDVQSTEDDTVSVRIQRAAQIKANRRAAEILKNLDVQIAHEGSDVKIEAKFTGNAKRWKQRKNDLDVQFDILVPRHYNLDLKTACDDISVANMTGDVKAETFSAGLRFQDITGRIDGVTSVGDINLKGFNGDVTLQTKSGNIALEDGTGEVKVKTTGGNLQISDVAGAVNGKTSGGGITLRGCKGGADLKTAGGGIEVENDGPVLAKTTGGSIRCQLQEASSRQNLLLDLETAGGGINVLLVPDIAATVEAKVLGGSVTTEFPVVAEMEGAVKPDQLHGTINGGGSLLRLRSIGGNIILRKTEAHDPTEV